MVRGVIPDVDTEFGRRVRARLRSEYVGWLTTTGRDGTPQPNPVWFFWDEPGELLVYSRADAHRISHLARTNRATLHLNGTDAGEDIVVASGRAEVVDSMPAPHAHAGYRQKYESGMTRVSGSPEVFSTEYPVPLVIHIERVRGF